VPIYSGQIIEQYTVKNPQTQQRKTFPWLRNGIDGWAVLSLFYFQQPDGSQCK